MMTLHMTPEEMNTLDAAELALTVAEHPTAVHPAQWHARCGYEALRETAEDLRRNAMWEGGSLYCSE